MNKQDFLGTVRREINNKSSDSLKKLVLDFARLIPRDNFDEALSFLEKREAFVVKSPSVDLETAVNKLCESVANGDYDLSWDYEEGYYDGYYSEDETLSDKDGLSDEIQDLLETAIIYVKEKRYSEAFSAFDKLFAMSIQVEDYDDIDIDTMFSCGLMNLDESEVLLYYAYAALMTLRGIERIHKFYEIMSVSQYNMSIPEVMAIGADDIPECKEFTEQWIAFLQTHELHRFEHVLIDAVIFSGGIKALHDFTIEHGLKYQKAYIRLTEMYIDEKDYTQAVFIISDGFSKLIGLSTTRTKLADLLMNIGKVIEDKDLIKKALWEGFVSSANLYHFINICAANDKNMKDMAIAYLDKLNCKLTDHNYIRFLYGDYESVYNFCKSDKSFLGWSISEKGKMLPLFIALLVGGKAISPCVKKLIEFNFPYPSIKDIFLQELAESYKPLPDTEWKCYLNWCLNEIEGRVEAIVRGQHRGSYDKVSALIVAAAEIFRSFGDTKDAVNFILKYKEKYPRHTSFRACLKTDIALAKFGNLF